MDVRVTVLESHAEIWIGDEFTMITYSRNFATTDAQKNSIASIIHGAIDRGIEAGRKEMINQFKSLLELD